ncbi:site-specific integrase [Streptomyces sp. NPDC020096]
MTRQESWTVLGGDDAPVWPIERYLSYLPDIERSPNTVKAYAHDLKDYFAFLAQHGLDWREVRLEDLGEFVAWLRRPPGTRDSSVAVLPSVEAHCSEATVNRKLSSLSAFYQHAARHGVDLGELLITWQPVGLCRPIRLTCHNRLAAAGERAGGGDRTGPDRELGDNVPQGCDRQDVFVHRDDNSHELAIALREAESPSWSVRASAGRRLAAWADQEVVGLALERLLLDLHNTAVTQETARALLGRRDLVGLRTVLTAMSRAKEWYTVDWLDGELFGYESWMVADGRMDQFRQQLAALMVDGDAGVRDEALRRWPQSGTGESS